MKINWTPRIVSILALITLIVMFSATTLVAASGSYTQEELKILQQKMRVLEERLQNEADPSYYLQSRARAEQADPQKELYRWDTNVWVFNSNNHEKHPSMCYDVNIDSWIYIAAEVWNENTGPQDIAIKRSINHGESWTSLAENYYLIPGVDIHPLMMPKIYQISADKIGMVYARGYSADDWDIHFRSFTTDDLSDNDENYVDVTVGKLTKPSLCSDYLSYPNDPYIHVVYVNATSPRQLLYKRSADLGITWQAPQILTTINSNVTSDELHTSIDTFGSKIAIAYVDQVGDENGVKVLVSNNSGANWGTSITIATENAAGYPQIRVVNNDKIVVVFEYWFTDLDSDIHYAYSTNGGSTFSDNLPLAETVFYERYPNISSFKTGSTGSDVYVSYSLLPDEIYIKKALDLDFTDWSEATPVKGTETDLSEGDISAIIVKPYDGTPKAAVAWAEHWTIYDIDVKFDAEWREETSADDPDFALNTTILKGNYPNPFNPDTNIEFYLAEATFVTIEVYNIKGQRVRTLVNDNYHSGDHRIVWNGTNDRGQTVGSGIYFYNMTTGNYTETKKMVLMK